MRLAGKTAIVTGSGRGIGQAIAGGFSQEGANVVVTARTTLEIERVAQTIERTGGRSLAIGCDITDEGAVEALVRRTIEVFGGVDILVNNAGIASARPVWGLSKRSFEDILQVNLVGSFLCTKHVWRHMKERGGGSIINVSSLGGIVGYPMLSAYCASKSGQIGLTKACAEEGKPDQIRVNAIAPGKGDTKLRASIPEDKGRLLRPEDHVGVCVFLASDESRYVTGQVIPIEWYGPD
jgi:NAD(P)-dependent dehydrogenase (short-subunit alcohol dehydrogenase family)